MKKNNNLYNKEGTIFLILYLLLLMPVSFFLPLFLCQSNNIKWIVMATVEIIVISTGIIIWYYWFRINFLTSTKGEKMIAYITEIKGPFYPVGGIDDIGMGHDTARNVIYYTYTDKKGKQIKSSDIVFGLNLKEQIKVGQKITIKVYKKHSLISSIR